MPNLTITPSADNSLVISSPTDQVVNINIVSDENETLDLSVNPVGESAITLSVENQGVTNLTLSQDVVFGGSSLPDGASEGDLLFIEGGVQVWKNAVDVVSSTLSSISFAPTTSPDTVTTVEDTAITGNVLTNDTTLTGSLYITGYRVPTLTNATGALYSAGVSSTTNPVGTFIMYDNGSWSLNPRLNVDFNLPTITYYVSNGVSNATGTLKINITPVNDAPLLGNDVLTGEPDLAVVVNVLGNDSDVEGGTLTITKVNSTNVVTNTIVSITNATVKLKADQTFEVTPSAGYLGSVNFTYTVSDGLATTVGNVTVNFVEAPMGGGTSNYVVSTTTPINFDWAANKIAKLEQVVEPTTGATIRRLTDVTQDQIGQLALYNAYSRYPCENVTGEYVIAFCGNSTTSLVMSRATGGIVCTLAYDATGLATHTIGAYHEVRWHYTLAHPYRVYFVRGQQFWMIDDVRNQNATRTMIKDFSTVIDWAGTPDSSRMIYMDQEGNSSLDSDHWAWMAAYYDGSKFVVRAYIHYQVSTDTVHIMYPSGLSGFSNAPANESSRTTFLYKPNMVEVAPDGSGIVIGYQRAYAGSQDAYMSSAFEAPYFWPLDFNPATFTPFRLAADASHSGWSSVDGEWYYVFGDNRRDKWSATPISGVNKGYGNEGQLDVFADLGPGVIDFHSDGGIYPGYHFGVCTGAADGWTFVSTYAVQDISTNGLANTLHMMQIKPEAQCIKWMIAPACNLTPGDKADYNEAPASINLAGTRVITPGDWNGYADTMQIPGNYYFGDRLIDMYEIALPDNWQSHFTPSLPVNNTAPTISGTATQGQTLTRFVGGWSGYPSPTLTGNWQRNGVDISGATSSTYLLQAADVGTTIRYREIATNTSGVVSAYSTSTATVAGLAIPQVSVVPSITGNVIEGSVLVGSDGTWTNSPTGYTRAWLRDGSVISGATGSNYTLVSADVGTLITYRVVAINGLGSSAPATSNPVGPITLSPGTITRVSSVISTDPSGSSESTRSSASFNAVAGNLIVVAIRYDQMTGSSISSVVDTAGNTYTAGPTATTLSGGFPSVAQLWYCLSSNAYAGNVVTVTQVAGSNGLSNALDLSVVQYTTSSGTWTNSSNAVNGTDYVAQPITSGSFNMPANSVAVALYGNYYANVPPINTGGATLVSTNESVGWVLEKITGSALTSQTFTSGDSGGGGYTRMAVAVGVFRAS